MGLVMVVSVVCVLVYIQVASLRSAKTSTHKTQRITLFEKT